MKRVVITGIGIYSSIGKNISEVKDSLYNGKSGIIFDRQRKDLGYQSALTGKIDTPDLKPFLDRRARISMPDQAKYAYVATAEALKNANLSQEFLNDNIIGIIYGNDSSTPPVIESIDIMRDKKDTQLIGSGSVFQSMNSTVTMNLAVIFHIKGINFTLSAACASGSHSVGMAYLLIKHGYQNAIICGGAQEVNIYCVGSFDALGAFSKREAEPAKASRPFDKSRDGLVPSGGAATLILEDYDFAVKRGAPILAEIVGYGFSSDGMHISVPDIDGPKCAMNMSLKDASLSPSRIQYINAHATSTPLGDANEAQAIDLIFRDSKPYVSSTKSMTGHEMWMAGASELVYSIIMMKNSFIAPNINFEVPDEHTSKVNIVSKTMDCKFDTFLSNSFGFGGTNSSIIIKNLN